MNQSSSSNCNLEAKTVTKQSHYINAIRTGIPSHLEKDLFEYVMHLYDFEKDVNKMQDSFHQALTANEDLNKKIYDEQFEVLIPTKIQELIDYVEHAFNLPHAMLWKNREFAEIMVKTLHSRLAIHTTYNPEINGKIDKELVDYRYRSLLSKVVGLQFSHGYSLYSFRHLLPDEH